MTTKQVHIHLQEISERYKKGYPNLTVTRIAKESGSTVEALRPHLDRLMSLGLIHHAGKVKGTICLTENGKQLDVEL